MGMGEIHCTAPVEKHGMGVLASLKPTCVVTQAVGSTP